MTEKERLQWVSKLLVRDIVVWRCAGADDEVLEVRSLRPKFYVGARQTGDCFRMDADGTNDHGHKIFPPTLEQKMAYLHKKKKLPR